MKNTIAAPILSRRDFGALALAAGVTLKQARAQSAKPLTIGVLNDASATTSDLSGRGAVTSAELAIADFGPTVLGRPIAMAAFAWSFGSVRTGIEASLPSRARAITARSSAMVPVKLPCTVWARQIVPATDKVSSPPPMPTRTRCPPFGRIAIAVPAVASEPTKSLVQVKTPAESKGPWDYYTILRTLPGDQAFLPLSKVPCPYLKP